MDEKEHGGIASQTDPFASPAAMNETAIVAALNQINKFREAAAAKVQSDALTEAEMTAIKKKLDPYLSERAKPGGVTYVTYVSNDVTEHWRLHGHGPKVPANALPVEMVSHQIEAEERAERAELRPPPEHEGKPYRTRDADAGKEYWPTHFLRGNGSPFAADHGPEFFIQNSLGDWFRVGLGWSHAGEQPTIQCFSYGGDLPQGYRYLGPAEWKPVAWQRDAVLQMALGRVAELETEKSRFHALHKARMGDRLTRSAIFLAGIATRDQVVEAIITEPELTALGWTCDPTGDWHRFPPVTKAEDRAHDRTGPSDEVHKRVNDVIGDLINGRVTSKPTREALRDAVNTADKLPPPNPTGASKPSPWPERGRLTAEPMAIGVRLP